MIEAFNLGGPGSLVRLMFAFSLLAALPGLLLILRQIGQREILERRLGGARSGALLGGGIDTRTSFMDAIKGFIANIGRHATPASAAERSAIQQKLIQAGYAHPDAVSLYYAARVITVLIPALGLLIIYGIVQPSWANTGSFWLAGPMAIGAGVLAPTMYLDRKVEARRKACFKGLPDMMDLLVACVEAGLGLDAAVLRVADELTQRHPILARHIRTVGLEMRAGKARRAAWKTFADRVGLEDAQSLATMLRQAEEMGTSLGDTLRVLSKDMRARRMLKAEEQAMALSAKLTLPLILFVFPVLLGVLILPAVLRLQDVF